MATGSNIKWYANATGGSPLPVNTALTDGLTYYASLSLSGGCESATRTAVTAHISQTDAPTGNTNQAFCELDQATVNDLVATGTGIIWYGTATSGTALSPGMLLVNGHTYYAAQVTAGCESLIRLAVTVQITSTPPPTGLATQSFCAIDAPTVGDLEANGTATAWYTTATGGTILNVESQLTDGTTYYATQMLNGCESAERLPVLVSITSTPAPSGAATQAFCEINLPTVADLSAMGSDIQWYDAPSGGSLLTATSPLANATTYYASQTASGCESAERLAVLVTISATPAPVGSAAQSFCANATPTVGDLDASGDNIIWYSEATGGTALSSGTPLVGGATYYATQTNTDCESTDRLAVQVTVHPSPLADATTDIAYCANETTAAITFTGTLSATTYTWINTNTAIGLGASGTGDITPFQAQNTGNTDEVANITVTPVANGCSGAPVSFTITVHPQPAGQLLEDKIVCEDDQLTLSLMRHRECHRLR